MVEMFNTDSMKSEASTGNPYRRESRIEHGWGWRTALRTILRFCWSFSGANFNTFDFRSWINLDWFRDAPFFLVDFQCRLSICRYCHSPLCFIVKKTDYMHKATSLKAGSLLYRSFQDIVTRGHRKYTTIAPCKLMGSVQDKRCPCSL